MIRTIILATAAIGLSAAPAAAQMASSQSRMAPSQGQMMAAMSPTQYVKKAGAGDLYEKQSSQLMLGSTKNAKIRQFAQHMITDHTKTTNEVKQAAMKAGLHPAPPMLDAQQSRMMAQLRAAKGTARDRLYVQQQKMAHQQALQLHQTYAQDGTSQPLKMAASQVAPVVQSHIDMLHSMSM